MCVCWWWRCIHDVKGSKAGDAIIQLRQLTAPCWSSDIVHPHTCVEWAGHNNDYIIIIYKYNIIIIGWCSGFSTHSRMSRVRFPAKAIWVVFLCVDLACSPRVCEGWLSWLPGIFRVFFLTPSPTACSLMVSRSWIVWSCCETTSDVKRAVQINPTWHIVGKVVAPADVLVLLWVANWAGWGRVTDGGSRQSETFLSYLEPYRTQLDSNIKRSLCVKRSHIQISKWPCWTGHDWRALRRGIEPPKLTPRVLWLV